MTRNFLIISLICLCVSCDQDLKIKDVIVTDRLFSPDKNYIALTYYIDHGAMGETPPLTSILKVTDTLGLLNNSTLPCFDLSFYSCYYPDHWIDNKTLQVYLNERPFVKEGIPFDSSSVVVNGITCKVVPFDFSYHSNPIIEYFQFSPDRKKLLVVYTYEGDMNISVINYLDKLPRIGNILTNVPIEFNPINYVTWNGKGIQMFLHSDTIFTVNDFLVSDYVNKNISYNAKFIDSKELNESYDDNGHISYAPLYNDNEIDSLLKNNGIKKQATITETRWQKPNNKSFFYYEYEYKVGEQKFRSYFRTFKEFNEGADYNKGDSIMISYDPKQPLIHKMEKNYSR